jgi:hypothetical protein
MVLRNDELMMQIASEFQRTDDYSFAFETLIGNHLALPGLRGFWPMSVKQRDLGPIGLDFTNSGTQFGYITTSAPYVPCANFGAASTDRLYIADQAELHVSGLESSLISATRGLTAGLWVNFGDLGTANECLMGIWESTNNDREWMLYANTSSQIGAYISSNGTAFTNKLVSSSTHGISNDEWHHLVLQWSPSAQDDHLRIWYDGNYQETTTVGYASLNDSAANFGIGHNYAGGSPTTYFEGQLSMAFFCECNLKDAAIKRLYYRTRPAFQSRNQW